MGRISWIEVFTGLVGGVALFLLGIQQLTRALQNTASQRLRALLLRVSGTPLRGAASGAAATSVIQSSTATVLLIVGFVAAGAMTLRQAVAVVLGANVGTTVTVQVIALDVTRFALLMLACGVAITMIRRLEPVHGPGRALLALGLLFLGMDVMATAVAPLRDAPALAEVFARDTAVGIAMVTGAVFTVVVQSSSATAGVLVVLASQGLLDLHIGIAALMGAAIGTCVSPLLAGLATERAGLRVAVTHALVNVTGVGVWIWLIPQLAAVAVAISPSTPELSGTAQLAADTPRQLANAYTIFKVANLLLFIGFTRRIARLVERLVRDRPGRDAVGAIHLDEDVLDTPDLALELAQRELGRLGHEVVEMVDDIIPTVLEGNGDQLDALAKRDSRVDAIYTDLLAYLGAIGQQELTREQGAELFTTFAVANDLESIGDVIETNLVPLGHRRLTEGVVLDQPTVHAISEFHSAVARRLRQAVTALAEADVQLAANVVASKRSDIAQRDAAIAHIVRQLCNDATSPVRTHERAAEVVGHLQRIAGLTRHLARTIADGSSADPPAAWHHSAQERQ